MEDEYTLCATTRVPGADGTLCRYFNFAAEQVTTIFNAKAEMKDDKSAGGYDGGVSVAVSVALTSQMHIQKFSDLDSDAEIELMRAKLAELGGKPPASDDLGKGKKMRGTVAGLGKG
jgi:hypothetical protein